MATVFLSPIGNGFNFATTTWLPLNAGLLYTYLAGTTTLTASYTTSAGNVANANPIVLGVDGRPPYEIWFPAGSSYKIVVADSANNTIATYDNLTGINDVTIPTTFVWVAAGGSSDAITATYSPAISSLTDGLLLGFRAAASNTTTTPTFAPSGLTAYTITKNGGAALLVGDIVANLSEYFVRYNLANTRWELMNPAATTAATAATTAMLAANNTWTKAQRGAYVTLSSTSNSIAVDLSLSNNFKHSLTENTSLSAPTNIVAGQSGVIEFTQNAGAAKTLSFNNFWRVGSGVSLTISTTLSSANEMCYVVDSSGTFATCTMQSAVSATPATGVAFSVYFLSAAQTIASAGGAILAHGLGAAPKLLRIYLTCISAEQGYSVGDVLECGANMNYTGNSTGVSVVPDATNLTIRYGASTYPIAIIRKDNGVGTAIDPTKWQAYFAAWA